MVYCMVHNCKSRHGRSASGEKISFHKFPVGKNMRKEWESRIGRGNLRCSVQSVKAARLCSLHFTEDCYSVSRTTATRMGHTFTRWKLKDDAVPTLFINEPCQESIESSKSDEAEMVFDEMEEISDGDSDCDAPLDSDVTISDNENLKCDQDSADHHGKIVSIGNQTSCNVQTESCDNKDEILKNHQDSDVTQKIHKLTNSDLCFKTKVVPTKKPIDYASNNKSILESDNQSSSKKLVTKCSDTHEECTPVLKVNDSVEISQQIPSNQRIQFKDIAHTKDSLKEGQLLICGSCGLGFSSEVILINHEASCKPKAVNSLCNDDLGHVNEKLMQGEKVAEASNVIQICLSDYENLSTSKFFICACGFTASSSMELIAHSSAHVLEETSVCMICKAIFQGFLQLQLHVHKCKHFWTIEGKLPSPSLPKLESSSTSIPAPGHVSQPSPNPSSVKHLLHKTNEFSSDGKVGAMDLTINGLKHVGTPLKCGLCHFTSTSARDLLNHRKLHFTFDAPKPGMESAEYSMTKIEANAIDGKDKELLRCDLCGYSSKSAIELLQHKTFHSSEGPFRCNICSYATKSAINLLQHKKGQFCHVKSLHSSSEKIV